MSTSPLRTPPRFAVPYTTTQRGVLAHGWANDSGQKVIFGSDGSLAIQGNARNNGSFQSTLSVVVDGREICVGFTGGQTPEQTQALLGKALPPGYRIKNIPTLVAVDGVFFQIVKDSKTVNLDEAFDRARATGSFAGEKLSVVELRKIVAGLLQEDGFSNDEKSGLAHAYAGLFNGAKWNATTAAQEEFAKIKDQYGLPTVFVR